MEMNLKDLFEVQRKLDAEIEKKHPVAPGEDRLAKRILALQVELGECANEWRGFKFWSVNQHPKPIQESYDSVTDTWRDINPLLEEYVDVVHFMLSIGLEHGRTEHRHNKEFEYGPDNVIEMFSMLFRVNWADRDNFDYFVGSIIKLGEMLGFTWGQIEKAYMSKNATNWERQANGY